MQEGVERFGHRIHAFCLMNNHVHLLVQSGTEPLGKAMQNLVFRYAKRLNKKFQTTGHRFQGRYFSGIIEDDSYLLEVLKYIHLNPVRANIVRNPSDFSWSSHNYYLNKEIISWVERDYCLGILGPTKSKAIEGFHALFNTPQSESVIAMINTSSSQYLIGSDEFAEKIQKISGCKILLDKVSIKDVVETSCMHFEMSVYLVKSEFRSFEASFIRGVIGYILTNFTKNSLASLSIYTGKSSSTLSRSTKNISQRIMSDKEFYLHIDAILHRLEAMNATLQH